LFFGFEFGFVAQVAAADAFEARRIARDDGVVDGFDFGVELGDLRENFGMLFFSSLVASS